MLYVSITIVLTNHTCHPQNKSLKSQAAGHTCIHAHTEHTLKPCSDLGVPGLGYRAAVTAASTAVPPSHELIPGTPTVKVIRKFPETCHSAPRVRVIPRAAVSYSFTHIPTIPTETAVNAEQQQLLIHTLKIATLINFLQKQPAAREMQRDGCKWV